MVGLSVKWKVQIDFKALVVHPVRNQFVSFVPHETMLNMTIGTTCCRTYGYRSSRWNSYSIIPPQKPVGIYSVNSPSDASVQAVNLKKDLSRKTDGWGIETAYTPRHDRDNSGVSQPRWNTESTVFPSAEKLKSSSCHEVRHLMTNTQTHLHSAISSSWSIKQSKHSHF